MFIVPSTAASAVRFPLGIRGPYCRKVREALTMLDLEDPNTGAALFESRDIVRYLADTYSA